MSQHSTIEVSQAGDFVPYVPKMRVTSVDLMTTRPPPSGTTPEIQLLSEDQCWERLRGQVIGRLAVVVEDHPDIFPINYAVGNGSLVFRTAEGTKLHGSTSNTPVAFEIDGYEPQTEQAWSVVLRGTVLAIRADSELAMAENLTLEPWQAGVKNHLMQIMPLNISGRRFHVTKPDIWRTPLADARRASFE
ncbi:pyridoxamine 5'-phosphate oxidase family protein [Arthrobacter sp. N199823]|uniref:pyridoxamine 5'-phosphate oxidase family protein n=1 Tax=Arthrobacter sp. N199823 TaxID=2058895 RepID=UPI002157432B|nr:pyridoxamine 5'-phosphate oxidase family protein [Arthrobacter sp. N199823]